jgi:hypothetical protein
MLVIVAFCYNSSRISQPIAGILGHSATLRGLPNMRRLRGQRTAAGQNHPRGRAEKEESELALLAQFMRHDSVASLANAIAKRAGAQSEDLIAAAGLDRRHTDS